MSAPATYQLLNDLVLLSAKMQEEDHGHITEWRRVGFDARALLRLAIAEGGVRGGAGERASQRAFQMEDHH